MPKFFSKAWSKSDFDRIRELISMAAESGAAEVEIEADGVRVLVRQYVAPNVQEGASAPIPVTVRAGPSTTAVIKEKGADPAEVESSPSSENESANGTPVLAPTPGTFYAKPSPDSEPFVQVGDNVSKGQTVCIIEAMKLMNEVESEIAGTVTQILVGDGDPVEYDQPLLLIESP
ncbi:MAG: acetyl-CoA carboxylase biotin carboxyl carrier protein [Rhodothermaceae bacterium]|nr:acetyl-CoA carboxylase biotin carboxyl carrier protein [Rhodothermaceae bacterium]MYI84113.1 acetyl-CoA carboxylase biotin carboxyl carrier protein [Rhodothermaceae bacterium]